MKKAFILRPQEGRLSKAYNVLGMPVHLKVSSNDTGGQMSIFIAEYKRSEGPPLHMHDNDEAFFIIEGEFIFFESYYL